MDHRKNGPENSSYDRASETMDILPTSASTAFEMVNEYLNSLNFACL